MNDELFLMQTKCPGETEVVGCWVDLNKGIMGMFPAPHSVLIAVVPQAFQSMVTPSVLPSEVCPQTVPAPIFSALCLHIDYVSRQRSGPSHLLQRNHRLRQLRRGSDPQSRFLVPVEHLRRKSDGYVARIWAGEFRLNSDAGGIPPPPIPPAPVESSPVEGILSFTGEGNMGSPILQTHFLG